ncbi:MAG: vanadium-dependent haloperoxidase [Burkholderiaceae bacterium]
MNRFPHQALGHLGAVACATLLAVGCGGTDLTEDEIQAREDAQKAAIAIQSHGPNPISIWNEVAFKTAGNISGHDLVTVHLAMYDAVMAIAGTHQPYAIRPATSGAGGGAVVMEAAAIEAAYRVVKGLFPAGGANYETAYTQGIGALLDGAEKTRGMAIGAEVAAGMLALRSNDGRATVLPPYVPGTLPGQFRGTNPVNRVAPYVKPFATLSHAQFRAPGPLALDSAAYAVDFNEVKAMGSAAASTSRNAAQTEIARFHTESPNTFWARNLRQFATANVGLADNARLTAMIWAAWQDAGSGCFESKYHHNFWRPTSAITLADTDGNASTQTDMGWTPVVPTPNHPEYPAAHGCASGAVAEAVRSFYGMKKVTFEFTSSVTGTTTHRYERTDDLVKEITDARVWGGMHFRTSGEHGAELGKQVAKWVAKNHFQPAN